MTAAEKKALAARRIALITENAMLNGRFLREAMEKPEGHSLTAIATARAVSLLITLRSAAQAQKLTDDEVQAAIDGFMQGAEVSTATGPMGNELYTDVKERKA